MKNMNLGRLVLTMAVSNLQDENAFFATFIRQCFNRYLENDWGDLSTEDWDMNDRAIETGDDRILASYNFPSHAPWAATNAYGG